MGITMKIWIFSGYNPMKITFGIKSQWIFHWYTMKTSMKLPWKMCPIEGLLLNQLAKETRYSRSIFARNSSRQKTPTTESPPSVKQSRTTSNPERCSFVAFKPPKVSLAVDLQHQWQMTDEDEVHVYGSDLNITVRLTRAFTTHYLCLENICTLIFTIVANVFIKLSLSWTLYLYRWKTTQYRLHTCISHCLVLN